MTNARSSMWRRAQRLIWGVAALGIGCSLLNLGIIAVVLQDVSRAGARTSRISLVSADVVASIEMYRRRSGRWVDAVLSDASRFSTLAPIQANLQHRIDAALLPLGTSPDLRDQAAAIHDEFRSSLGSMASLAERVSKWADARHAVDADLPRAAERAASTHAALRSAAADHMDRLRQERLARAARYRDAAGPEAQALAHDLIFEEAGPAAALAPVETELSELGLLIAEIRSARNVDQLEGLRASRLAPSLQRLSGAVARYAEAAPAAAPGFPATVVAEFERALVGPGEDPPPLLALVARSIALDREQVELRARYDASLEAFTRCQQHLTLFVQASMSEAALDAGASVRTAQLLSAVALIFSAVSILFLGRSVARSVARQASQLEATNRSLDQAIAAADAANRAKSDFLANMSHEIRTPMTAVIGYAELLLDPAHSPSDRVNHLQTIRRNADHLLAIINDILDLSKIEAGALTVDRVRTCPSQIIHEVVSLLNVRAAAKAIELRVVFDTPLPAAILSDPLRLRQILLNLVGNALKFTDEGSVTVYVALVPASLGAPAAITFSIADTGIGMTDQQMALLFKPFSQADESSTRRFGGTGLGLAISKRLACLLGGDISVQCSLGRGCTFTLSIDPGPLDAVPMVDPAQLAQTRPAAAPAAAPEVRLTARLLLAEDGPDNQRLLSHILRTAGAHVDIVDNGRAAVDAALANSYDVILLDMQMPELDGYSAASLLRQRGYTRPIMALTAHAMADDRAKCIAAGCDEYLTKPIDRHKLLSAILDLVARSAPKQSAA